MTAALGTVGGMSQHEAVATSLCAIVLTGLSVRPPRVAVLLVLACSAGACLLVLACSAGACLLCWCLPALLVLACWCLPAGAAAGTRPSEPNRMHCDQGTYHNIRSGAIKIKPAVAIGGSAMVAMYLTSAYVTLGVSEQKLRLVLTAVMAVSGLDMMRKSFSLAKKLPK